MWYTPFVRYERYILYFIYMKETINNNPDKVQGQKDQVQTVTEVKNKSKYTIDELSQNPEKFYEFIKSNFSPAALMKAFEDKFDTGFRRITDREWDKLNYELLWFKAYSKNRSQDEEKRRDRLGSVLGEDMLNQLTNKIYQAAQIEAEKIRPYVPVFDAMKEDRLLDADIRIQHIIENNFPEFKKDTFSEIVYASKANTALMRAYASMYRGVTSENIGTTIDRGNKNVGLNLINAMIINNLEFRVSRLNGSKGDEFMEWIEKIEQDSDKFLEELDKLVNEQEILQSTKKIIWDTKDSVLHSIKKQ